jgi:predicted glycosyltransferase
VNGLAHMNPYRPIHVRTLLFYAQDDRGLGHVTRTLNIARHVLARFPDCVAYIATKSPLAGFTLPDRCDYIKLPNLLPPPPEASPWTVDQEDAAKLHFRTIRAQVLRDAVLGLAPDLVLVDHEPLGSKGEFRDGLYALKAERPATRFVCGLRDIQDDAGRIRALWQEVGVYDVLERVYDSVAVYGSRQLYDVAEAYGIPASIRSKLHYCGHVVREPLNVPAGVLRLRLGLPEHAPVVLAVVGSGSDGYPVLEAARAAVEKLQAGFPGLHAILVTGPFMPADKQARLQAQATATCRVMSWADNFELMAAADAVVSMGGYNGVFEALVQGRPLVIVPRANPRKAEQQIRAETLSARGLARWIHPERLTADNLAEALAWALGRNRLAHARLIREVIPSFDGAGRLTEYLSRWLGPAATPAVDPAPVSHVDPTEARRSVVSA